MITDSKSTPVMLERPHLHSMISANQDDGFGNATETPDHSAAAALSFIAEGKEDHPIWATFSLYEY